MLQKNIIIMMSFVHVYLQVLELEKSWKMLFASTWNQEESFEDMVFTSQTGAPIRYGDVNRTIKTVITKANLQEEEIVKLENREPLIIKEFLPHCFRHTFVTRCRMKGIPYEAIQPYVQD